jgi:pimeloyl-ACP methyl ester carboxylesterase
MSRITVVLACVALLTIPFGQSPASAQERTLEEIKREITRRAATRTPPFDHVRADEVATVLQQLTSLDKEEWGTKWCKAGLDHEATADAMAKQGAPAKALAEEYDLAFGYCLIGRYPVPSSPAKMESYRHALRMFRKAARHFEVPLEVLEIPFEGKKIVAYLQVPKGATPPPVVMYWGGVDVWKEDSQRNSALMHKAGLATLLIDNVGTGESPVAFRDPTAERVFIAAMDHLKTRKDVDGARIGIWGRSFGAYWVAKLAHVYPDRVKAGVFHGGNVHFGFQEEWLRPALTKNAANYLLGPTSLFDSRSWVLGVKTLDEVYKVAPSLSLKDKGLLDKPSAPLFIVNGKLDDQAPIADSYLLMEHGSPKEVRIVPDGGHMGVKAGVNPDILATMIANWLKLRLSQ